MNNERPSGAIQQRIRNANSGGIPWMPVTDDPARCSRCGEVKRPSTSLCARCVGTLCPACCEYVTGVRS